MGVLIIWEGITLLGLVVICMELIPIFKCDTPYIFGFISGVICIAIQVVCIRFMNNRTPKGGEILGKILGFKYFLKTAEKEKLEALVNENPSYFYDILPYTYVLGVSKKWIKKFEDIAIPPAEFYASDFSDFSTMRSLSRFVSSSMSAINHTVSSHSSSSSGGASGGFSGGGFSGGGGGGGGGSSW